MESKNITIQIWTDMFYCRTVGIWYPSTLKDNEAPFVIVTSSMFEPREEVMGTSPIAPGQHPMPKEFMEQQVRHMSYLFANEFGIFQAPSKPLFKTFMAKQTTGYSMVKEFKMNVTPATGSITLEDLRNSIDQYSIEEQKRIQVMTVGEHPKDADAKHIDQFIHSDKYDGIQQYISITKLVPVYNVDDTYIVNSHLPLDPLSQSFAPNTETHPLVQNELEKVSSVIEIDRLNRELLAIIDASPTPLTREEALMTSLSNKNSQLIGTGIISPTLPTREEIPQPMKESDMYNIPGVTIKK